MFDVFVLSATFLLTIVGTMKFSTNSKMDLGALLLFLALTLSLITMPALPFLPIVPVLGLSIGAIVGTINSNRKLNAVK